MKLEKQRGILGSFEICTYTRCEGTGVHDDIAPKCRCIESDGAPMMAHRTYTFNEVGLRGYVFERIPAFSENHEKDCVRYATRGRLRVPNSVEARLRVR